MADSKQYNIILAGNPNIGKTSLFNSLTGLNHKVGNYAGVTVDKVYGNISLPNHITANLIDLPGIYGLYPKSEDELVAHEMLVDPIAHQNVDVVLFVLDASNLKRNLLLCSQIKDLNHQVVIAMTMMDVAEAKGINIDIDALSEALNIPIIVVNPRSNKGIDNLKSALVNQLLHPSKPTSFRASLEDNLALQEIAQLTHLATPYAALISLQQLHLFPSISADSKAKVEQVLAQKTIAPTQLQAEDTLDRYTLIDQILKKTVTNTLEQKRSITKSLDKILLHPILGYVIMLLVLFVVFQAIFWLASIPMDWIDAGMSSFSSWVGGFLPEGKWYSDLITEGIISGLGGIIIFVPQIAILFFFISLLEDTGYMSRISFLMDRIMKSVGMNGRSVMPLISGMACAIPAVMAARSIRDPKERLITILVTPLMSCSARLPVYTLLIAMFVPSETIMGIFNLQGLIMMLMYLLGIIAALIVAWVLQFIIKKKDQEFFLMELPIYQTPRWENAFITMFEKAKIFVVDAGKVILVLSIALWFLASYGPTEKMDAITQHYENLAEEQGGNLNTEQEEALNNDKLAQSYAGILGRTIEPAIAPLGYDWKIGIALISSFAAREVFVGTMATLYAVGDVADDDTPLREKMLQAKRKDGTPVYTLATGMSLLVFYAFAMQCISTLAVVKRETKSWKWTLVQLGYLTALAYVGAWVTYHLFS